MAIAGAWVDTRSVEHMLMRLDSAISPVGLVAFLGGTVDPYLRQRASERFANEGDDVTGKWAPLSQATQSIRQQMGYGGAHPINVRTGEMEDYITDSPNNLAAHPWGASLTLPGNEPQGELLKKVRGAQQGENQAPPRPVIGMNERDLAYVLLALYNYVQAAV